MREKFRYKYEGLSAGKIEILLKEDLQRAICARYGSTPDAAITKRIKEEWNALVVRGSVLDVAALYELTLWLKQGQHPYWIRGSGGSSFIFYLLGITTGNPLPAHLYCSQCKSVQWRSNCTDGFDLMQEEFCKTDQTVLTPDGHNIPWQTLWGYRETPPVLDIDLPERLYDDVMQFFEQHWLCRLNRDVRPYIPHEQMPLLIKFSNLSVLCHIDSQTAKDGFYNHNKEIDKDIITCSLQEWRALTGCQHNNLPKPDRFGELLSIYGLEHSTGVWDHKTKFMIDQLGYTVSDMIAFRDDVFFYLLDHGLLEKDAWISMDSVRKGCHLLVVTDEMAASRDKWVIDRCENIAYLFPKSHALEHILFQLKAKNA